MKKFLAICLLVSLSLFSSCSLRSVIAEGKSAVEGEGNSAVTQESSSAEEPYGYIDLSLWEFEERFNNFISDDYVKAELFERKPMKGFTAYASPLEEGIELIVATENNGEIIYLIELRFAADAPRENMRQYGIYFRGMVEAVAPDLTDEEMNEIAKTLIDLEGPGDMNTVEKGEILYGMRIADDGEYSLAIMASTGISKQ